MKKIIVPLFLLFIIGCSISERDKKIVEIDISNKNLQEYYNSYNKKNNFEITDSRKSFIDCIINSRYISFQGINYFYPNYFTCVIEFELGRNDFRTKNIKEIANCQRSYKEADNLFVIYKKNNNIIRVLHYF